MEEKTENLFEELGKCIGTNANGVIVITDSEKFCELLDNHAKSFNQDEMINFFYLFWQNISIICGAEEDLNKQLTDSLNNNEKVSVNDEYKVFDEEILPHVIEKMNFDFETDKTISEELFNISVIDVYKISETGNNEEEEEKKGKNIPAYLQFILIFFALCKSKALTEKVVLNQLLSKCDFLFTDEIIENFISCCGDKVFLKKSLKTFVSKFHDKCKLSKEQWKQLMQCSADNAFGSEILKKFFNDTEKVKFDIDLVKELLRCADENTFDEEIFDKESSNKKNSEKDKTSIFGEFFRKCRIKSLSLNDIQNLFKCCPNEIFKNHFPEILEKCSEKIFNYEFVSKVFQIKGIISSEEVALNFLECCNEKVFDDKCFGNFGIKCGFEFGEEIILELIRVCDIETIKGRLSDIKGRYKEESLNANILNAVLSKFKNGEMSDDFLNNILKCFPIEVIQNNLIKILEKCDKEVLDNSNLKILSNKLSNEKSSEESVMWLFSNFPDESVKQYSYKILCKLKNKSSNEEFLNLVLKKSDMLSNLPNLLFKKFDEDLLKERLVNILRECSDNNLSEKNCAQILGYFKEGKIPDEVANELIRCVNSINWIFDSLDDFWDIGSNEEFLKAILKKFKSQSKVITSDKFDVLLKYFDDKIIKNNLIDILQNLEKEEEYLSGDVLNEVLGLYQLPDKMSVELSFFLFENFAEKAVKDNFLNILQRCDDDILNKEISDKILNTFADEKISDDLAKELIRCFNAEVFDSELINKFLDNCNENFHFDKETTEKFYRCFEKQFVTGEILVELLNKGFQFDVKVCKENNFQTFDLDIFISENYKDLSKKLHDKSAVKNFAALYNSYNKSNIKIGYGIGIGIGLLILLIAGGLSIATFGLGALAVSGVMIATIAVTAAVGLAVTSVFSSFIHMLRLSLAMIIKNFLEQKYQDNPIVIAKEMEEEIAPDMRFWLKVKESKSKKINIKDEAQEPLLENHENQID